MPGPAISGFAAIVRELEQLRRDVSVLKLAQARTVPLGTSYRIEVRGTEAGATLWAVRSADGNAVQIAP